jgi:hypothetical protein
MRRTGRPPLDVSDPSVRVCVSIPAKRYDALVKQAAGGRVSVPELFRRAIAKDTDKKYIKQTTE